MPLPAALDAVGESFEDHAVGQAAGLEEAPAGSSQNTNTMISRFYNND